MADVELHAKLDMHEVDEALDKTMEKANRLVELLREAQDLANSLSGSKKMIDPLSGLNHDIEAELELEVSRVQSKDPGAFQNGNNGRN